MNPTNTDGNTDNLSYLKSRFMSRHVRIVDGAVKLDDHFPGGRLDATINPDGVWEIERTDFGAGKNEHNVYSVIAKGHGAESLGNAFDKLRDVLTNGVPEVGGPATYIVASDAHACTVIAVDRKVTRVTLRRDKATLVNGVESGEPDALKFTPGGFCGHTSGVQRHTYEPDPNGVEYVVTRRVRKNGDVTWKQVGHATTAPGLSAHFRCRNEHYDFNY